MFLMSLSVAELGSLTYRLTWRKRNYERRVRQNSQGEGVRDEYWNLNDFAIERRWQPRPTKTYRYSGFAWLDIELVHLHFRELPWDTIDDT